MGKTITHVGPIGAGQAVKAVNQVILAGAYLGVAEGIVLAIKAGLDVEQVVAALGGGAAQSWVLANRSGRMIDNDYPLGFKVALHLKDLGIALELARELGADAAGQRAGRPARGGAGRRRATATRTCPTSRASIRAAVGPRGLGRAGPTLSRSTGRQRRRQQQRIPEPVRRTAAGSAPALYSVELDVDRARLRPARGATRGRTCRRGSPPSGRRSPSRMRSIAMLANVDRDHLSRASRARPERRS